MSNQKFFDPGALNNRMLLQSSQSISDGCGGATVTWQDVTEIWVHLSALNGNRREVAQQNQLTVQHKISLRFRDDIQSGWRFVSGSRNFDVLTVYDPDERGRYLVCECEEEGQ